MNNNICIFEDINYSKLYPLTYLRPVYDLRCGILTLKEKILHYFPRKPIILHCREYLAGIVKKQNPGAKLNKVIYENCIFINGRVLADKQFIEQITLGGDCVYICRDTLVAAKVSGKIKLNLSSSSLSVSDFNGIPAKKINVKIINYPWDLITYNGEQITSDFKLFTEKITGSKIKSELSTGTYLINENNIFIDKGAKIKPGVVLDADEGPIYIGKNVVILPNSVIEGPAFIGNDTIIKIGAKIYKNTSIGEVCKVGGEVEDSIIHSYSNKQHDGYLGHSYLGSWINLGAGTNNSDLKNNYGNIRVTINNEEVDTGFMFAGLTMGDHSKCSINTMFNTGTVTGIFCNIFGTGFPKKYLPSFTWGGCETSTAYDIDKAINMAKRTMARRNIKLSSAEEKAIRYLLKVT
jgi:UDP-N-acetylglucosamine diphosphorylase/glucosamine-1-phosphate N-acetyltransferase